jgi:hypothetical protein
MGPLRNQGKPGEEHKSPAPNILQQMITQPLKFITYIHYHDPINNFNQL